MQPRISQNMCTRKHSIIMRTHNSTVIAVFEHLSKRQVLQNCHDSVSRPTTNPVPIVPMVQDTINGLLMNDKSVQHQIKTAMAAINSTSLHASQEHVGYFTASSPCLFPSLHVVSIRALSNLHSCPLSYHNQANHAYAPCILLQQKGTKPLPLPCNHNFS